jgi:hypothetical protein
MVKALFISKNLVGDALNISPAWRAWWASNEARGCSVELLTNRDQIAELYTAMDVPAKVLTSVAESELLSSNQYHFVFNFDVSAAFHCGIRERIHIAEAYARMLGVAIDSVKPTCELDAAPYSGSDIEPGCILVSPFSASCSSRAGGPPNKMLPFAKWLPILDYLKTLNRAIYVLGSSNDLQVPEFGIPRIAFLLGTHSLLQVARIMRDRASLLVTLDNGVAHLGASQEVPTIQFYPACLPMSWIFPRGNPHCYAMQLDPALCDPTEVLLWVQQMVPRLLRLKTISASH